MHALPIAFTLHQLHLFLIHLQKYLFDAVEKLAKKELSVLPLWTRCSSLYYFSLFSWSLPLILWGSLLLLLARFGATGIAMGIVFVVLNQFSTHSLTLSHFITPTSVTSCPLLFPEQLCCTLN